MSKSVREQVMEHCIMLIRTDSSRMLGDSFSLRGLVGKGETTQIYVFLERSGLSLYGKRQASAYLGTFFWREAACKVCASFCNVAIKVIK